VIGLSAVATFVAALGLTIGVWMFSPARRYRHGSTARRVPYRGWKRWHVVVGLIFGSAALTWAFSGMLSMDPFPLPGDPPQTDDVAHALRGTVHQAAFDSLSPKAALALLGPATIKQLELTSSDVESFYAATLESNETRIVDLSATMRRSLGAQQISNLVATAVQPDKVRRENKRLRRIRRNCF
jgi:hypothetical protein